MPVGYFVLTPQGSLASIPYSSLALPGSQTFTALHPELPTNDLMMGLATAPTVPVYYKTPQDSLERLLLLDTPLVDFMADTEGVRIAPAYYRTPNGSFNRLPSFDIPPVDLMTDTGGAPVIAPLYYMTPNGSLKRLPSFDKPPVDLMTKMQAAIHDSVSGDFLAPTAYIVLTPHGSLASIPYSGLALPGSQTFTALHPELPTNDLMMGLATAPTVPVYYKTPDGSLERLPSFDMLSGDFEIDSTSGLVDAATWFESNPWPLMNAGSPASGWKEPAAEQVSGWKEPAAMSPAFNTNYDVCRYCCECCGTCVP